MKLIFIFLLFATPALAADCDVKFNCSGGTASIAGKTYPIVCGKLTGQNGDGVLANHVIRADGPRRRGLVAPGTPMVATIPRLCYNCFIHAVSGFNHSLGCIGISHQGFEAIKACLGSKFSIARR